MDECGERTYMRGTIISRVLQVYYYSELISSPLLTTRPSEILLLWEEMSAAISNFQHSEAYWPRQRQETYVSKERREFLFIALHHVKEVHTNFLSQMCTWIIQLTGGFARCSVVFAWNFTRLMNIRYLDAWKSEQNMKNPKCTWIILSMWKRPKRRSRKKWMNAVNPHTHLFTCKRLSRTQTQVGWSC